MQITASCGSLLLINKICNPALPKDTPVFGQLPANRDTNNYLSFLMVKAGTWGEDHCQLHRFFPWKGI